MRPVWRSRVRSANNAWLSPNISPPGSGEGIGWPHHPLVSRSWSRAVQPPPASRGCPSATRLLVHGGSPRALSPFVSVAHQARGFQGRAVRTDARIRIASTVGSGRFHLSLNHAETQVERESVRGMRPTEQPQWRASATDGDAVRTKAIRSLHVDLAIRHLRPPGHEACIPDRFDASAPTNRRG